MFNICHCKQVQIYTRESDCDSAFFQFHVKKMKNQKEVEKKHGRRLNFILWEVEMLNRERNKIGKVGNLLLQFEYGGCLMIRCLALAQRLAYLELYLYYF